MSSKILINNSEFLSIEKENTFLKFYTADKAKACDLAVEDTTNYYIWREGLERSRDRPAEDVQPSLNADQNDLIIKEMVDWRAQGDYFEDFGHINYELLEDLDPIDIDNFEENHRVQVLENIVLVPAPERSSTPFTISHSEMETVPILVTEADSFEPTPIEACVIAKSEDPNVPLERSVHNSKISPAEQSKTVEKEPEVSVASLYKLPTTENCTVDEIFLNCLKQQPASQADNNQQKFRVPRIRG